MTSERGPLEGVPFFCVPNSLVDDEVMANLSGSATKVLIALYRKTLGWHKRNDQISLSQFMTMTGLGKSTIRAAVDELVGVGLLRMTLSTDGVSANTYTIVVGGPKNDTPPEIDRGQNLDPQKKTTTTQESLSQPPDDPVVANLERAFGVVSSLSLQIFNDYFKEIETKHGLTPLDVSRYIAEECVAHGTFEEPYALSILRRVAKGGELNIVRSNNNQRMHGGADYTPPSYEGRAVYE